MTAPIRFWFDFISPYAYLAWTQLPKLAEKHQRTFLPTPVLFAAMLSQNGTKGPAEIPSKRAYIFRDLVRSAAVLKVPFHAPFSHPFNPLLCLRVASLFEGAARTQVTELLFRAVWVDELAVTEPSVIATLLDQHGFDGARTVQLSQEEPAKKAVRDNTQEAIAAGVFGVPTMQIDGELFWGLDSFPHAERRLLGNDPLDGVDFTPFEKLQPSASRKL